MIAQGGETLGQVTSEQTGRPGDQNAAAEHGRAGRLCGWLIHSAALPCLDASETVSSCGHRFDRQGESEQRELHLDFLC